MNKIIDKKKSILIVSMLLLLVVIYVVYKSFIILYYTVDTADFKEIANSLKISDKEIIVHHQEQENNLLTFDKISVRNDFESFKLLEEQSTEDSKKYVLKDNDNNIVASFWLSKGFDYADSLKNDITVFTDDKRVTGTKNLTKILKENNITNDIELFEFAYKNRNKKNNIFTPTKKIKDDFTLKYVISIMTPKLNKITLIKGDLDGYILDIKSSSKTLKSLKEVRIHKNNQNYVLTFLNRNKNYFTNQYINELLNTVTITEW